MLIFDPSSILLFPSRKVLSSLVCVLVKTLVLLFDHSEKDTNRVIVKSPEWLEEAAEVAVTTTMMRMICRHHP